MAYRYPKGDYNAQRRFVDCTPSGNPFECTGEDYLKTVALVEACYRSHRDNRVVKL